MESLWGNENGWGNVSEECCFSVFDVAAAMQTEHICAHTFAHTHAYRHAHTQTHTQECMTVNHGCDVCVSGLRMKRRAKEHQGMLCIQRIEREREQGRERSLALLIFE